MENKILKLWIIDRDAGISVFEQTFDKTLEKMDSDLYGGFFMAILGFSQELSQSPIQYMQLVPFRVYFHLTKRHIMVFATSNTIPQEMVTNIATRIQNRFETKYNKYFEKGFNGDVSIFNNFADDVENELNQKCLWHSLFQEKGEQLENYYETSKQSWVKLRDQFLQQTKKFCPTNAESFCKMKYHLHEAIGKHTKKT